VSTAQADGPAALYEYDKTDGKTKEKFSPIIKEFSSGTLLTEVGGKCYVFCGIISEKAKSAAKNNRPDSLVPTNFLFLTSIDGQEYPFLVKGGTDSNLNGRDRRVA